MKIAVRKILVSEMETVSKGEYKEVAQTYRENVGKKGNKVIYNQQVTVEDNRTGYVRGQRKKEKLKA